MDGSPSGQRGQTVNLLSLTSVVRIHPLPPSENAIGISTGKGRIPWRFFCECQYFSDFLESLSLSKNAHQAKAEMGVLIYKRVKNEKNAKKREGWLSLHFLFANFLRFMAANLSLTQL